MEETQAKALAERQLMRLNQVLTDECPYVDRDSLGHWCGLSRPWWLPNSGYQLEDSLKLLRQLQDNEVPNIVLRVANRARLDDVGIIGYAMLSSSTLEQGLQLVGHLAEKTTPYVRTSLEVSGEYALLGCEVLQNGRAYQQLLLEQWLISLWRYIQVLLPEGVAACASYAALNYSSPTYHWQYQQMLGCKIDFDQPRALLAIPKQWLYIAIQGHNAQAQSLYDHQVERLLKSQTLRSDLVERVKRLLVEQPTVCGFSLEKTAPLLALSPRTLRRHLADAGSSFRQVCLDVRIELAKDYLLNTELTAQEVAYQLGYSQPNNFYRAFKSAVGSPPEQFRRKK